jgi:hypothetical protein
VVNNVQERFFMPLVISVPIVLFAYVIRDLTFNYKSILGTTSCLIFLMMIFYFFPKQPNKFFIGDMENVLSKPFLRHQSLFPLSKSLSSYYLSNDSLFILNPSPQAYWDIPMRFWPLAQQIESGSRPNIRIVKSVKEGCTLVKKNTNSIFIQAIKSTWNQVNCP